MKVKAILFLVLSCVVASAPANVPMRMAETVFSSYYYGDYDLPTNEISRSDWWGSPEYGLVDEATSPDAAGTFIALDDADDLSWEYYSNTDIPVHSNGAVNIVVKYYGCGMNMKDNVEVTDLGISPVVANDGGDNVKAIFYRKTIEKENAGDTYYTYTTIPNPFSRRPVRPNITAQTGANCKYLGFYGWAAEWSDCSLTYADGSSFISEGGFDNVVWPDRKLRVTVTGSNPTITFKALWKQAVVNYDGTISGFSNATNVTDPTRYERYFTIFTTAGLSSVKQNSIGDFPMTVTMLYPDGTDAGCYESGGTYTGLSCSEIYNYKVEYFNFTGSGSIVKNAYSDNANYYRRLVVGRGVKMLNGGSLSFIGMNSSNSTNAYVSNLGLGVNLRVESGIFTTFDAFYNSTEDLLTTGNSNNYPNINVANVNAENNIILGSDFDRWCVEQGISEANETLKITGDINLFRYVRFATNTAKFDVIIKSGTFGSSANDVVNIGINYQNCQPRKRASGAANSFLQAGRNVVMEGGVMNASIYGGRDENIEYSQSSSNNADYCALEITGDGYNVNNGLKRDCSNLYYKFRMKGGILNGDLYGGDNVDFSQNGSGRREITAQPRHLAFLGGTVNGYIYGGSYFGTGASNATTLINDTHLSALALTDVDIYLGGNCVLNEIVHGGDNNIANSDVKTLHSVRNVNIVASDGITVESIYGGGYGAGLGKNYNWETINPKANVNIVLKNANVDFTYGGIHGDEYADFIYGSTNITIDGGMYSGVFGGGHGNNIQGLLGSTTVTLNSGEVGEIYGGGDNSSVGQYTSDLSTININGGTVYGDVFGGGWRGISYSSPVINVKGGSVLGDVHGGACGGYGDYNDVVYTKGLRTINISDNANISGNVYGGSLNCNDQTQGFEIGYTGTPAEYGTVPVWCGKKDNYLEQFILTSEEMGNAKTISALSFPVYFNRLTYTITHTLTIYMSYTNQSYYTAGSAGDAAAGLLQVQAADKVVDAKPVSVNSSTTSLNIPLDTEFDYDGLHNVVITIVSTGSSSDCGSALPTSNTFNSLGNNHIFFTNYHRDHSQMIYIMGNGLTISKVENNINQSMYLTGNSVNCKQNAVPALSFEYSVSPSSTVKHATAFVNLSKGHIGGSVYGSGNNNKMYGGCYVNIGANAIANAPGHEANVNAIENPATGAITIEGSVYAGSDYGSSAWAYTDANRSVSGVSEVYLDGTGYSDAITIGGSKDATTGNIYGCSTNGEGGKLGSSVYISNIGSRNAQGKELSSTSWAVNSVQHVDTLVLNNAHVTFNGAEQIEDDTKTNSVYGVHKIMRVVNNSTVLLKADADSIAKVGSYQCTDVYADNPVYTEVTAVEGATGKTQLTDCKNTIVFTNGANLYVRSMESGTETYGELQGYLYAHNTDNFNMAQARARQKTTNNSAVTDGTDNATDGGFVSYDGIFNTYANPTADTYDGTGSKQEIAFRNVPSSTYRDWSVDKLIEVNLYAEKSTGGTYTSEAITLPATANTTWYMYATPGSQGGIYPNGGLTAMKSGFDLTQTALVDDLRLGLTVEASTTDGWSSDINKDLVQEGVMPGGTSTSYASIGTSSSTEAASEFKFVLYFDDEYGYNGDTLGYAIVRVAPTSGDAGQNFIRIWFLSIDHDAVPHVWPEAVTECPGTESWEIVNDTVLIKDKYGLAWFISYVNGFNGSSRHSDAKAKLCADVDMSEYIWVPIGYSTDPNHFKGYFDGQCYSIDGLHIASRQEADYVEAYVDDYIFLVDGMFYIGMFGYAHGTTSQNAIIKNTFVTSGSFYSWRAGSYIGSVAGSVNETTIEFCEGAATINATDGVSVGSVVGSLIHDSFVYGSMGMSTISSGMTNTGGILGACSDVSLNEELSYVEHCFANSDITAATSESYKVGAAVGHFYGGGFADPVYVHPEATGAANMLGDKTVATSITIDQTARGYTNNASMNYQYVNKIGTDITISNRAVYSATTPITYTNHDSGNKVTVSGNTQPLCDELNSRTFHDGSTIQDLGLHWDRVYGVTAINGDYPILYPQNIIDKRHIAVAQRTGEKALRYGSVNDLIRQCNANPDGGTIYMYQNDTIKVATNDNVVIYVNENVALMQEASKVNAVVAVTFDNSNGTAEESRDWHMFSPSISGGKTGVNYGYHQSTYTQFSTDDMTFGTEGAWDYNLKQGDVSVYFPDGITTAISNPGKQFDLYSFYEPEYHWINLKRASGNHWHEDEPHDKIVYENEETYTPGKGYMIALGDNTDHNNNLMQAKGVLNNGPVTVPVTAEGEHLTGYNLIGNPYQSYLDFNKFANANKNLWANTESIGYKSYLIYNADKGGFVEYLVDNEGVSFSQGAAQDGDRYINMHQGFFVVKNGTATEAVFEDTMRVTNQMPHFRDELPAYPLVNLFCTDSDGKQEVSVIELDRPANAGSLKLKGMLNGKGNMYVHWGSDDFGSVFIDHMPDFVPVWFDAAEDGVFTMTWNTANANFGYMHLIDNMTGVDFDCLAPGNDSYTFHASVNDMSARFRLVFKPLGIEEETTEQGENFAFFNGNELVVNGEGELSFIDLNGRVLATQYVNGQQSHITMPKVAVGMYMLRLTNGKETKVQKIVVRK